MMMRKLFPVLAAAAFALSIVAAGCDKEKSHPQPQPARKAIAGTEKNAAPKPHVKLFTGRIETLDAAAGTLTLKGQKGEKRFQVHEKVKEQLDGLKIGDKVIVKHVGEIALSIVKPRTSKNAQDMKEKGGAVEKVVPVPHSK
jgi:DNA helicase TIP49 (TBP-interacting protein)